MNPLLKLLPAALFASALSAHAAMNITIEESGNNVVVSGSGSIITQGTACESSNPPEPEPESGPVPLAAPAALSKAISKDEPEYSVMVASEALFVFSEQAPGIQCWLTEVATTGLPMATEEITSFPTSIAGDTFGMYGIPLESNTIQLMLPSGYGSASDLSFSAIFAESSLQDHGLKTGTYTWTWPVAGVQESITIVVRVAPAPATATPVPTLGVQGLIGLAGVMGSAGIAATRRRKP